MFENLGAACNARNSSLAGAPLQSRHDRSHRMWLPLRRIASTAVPGAVRHCVAQVHGLRLQEAQGDALLLTFDQQAAVFVSGAPTPRAPDQPAATVPAVGGAPALGYTCRVLPHQGMHAHELRLYHFVRPSVINTIAG